MPGTAGATQEQVLARLHPSRFAFAGMYIAAIFLVVVVVVFQISILPLPTVAQAYVPYTLLLLLPAVLLFLAAELRRTFDTYTITNMSVTERIGILRIDESDVSIDKISSSSMSQSALERMLDIGSIDLWSTGGSDEPEITITKIPNVHSTKEIVERLIREA
jgi:uncharacterized membrane protein YdbT with pleckstrin-like domain